MSSDCQRLVADEQLNSSPWSARHEQSAAGESARGGRRRPPVISRGRCASAFVEWLGERGRRGRRRRRGPGVDQGPFARRRIAGLPHARHGRRAGCGGGAQLRVANPGAAYFRARRAGDRLPGTPTGAAGFLLKDSTRTEIVKAVLDCAKGRDVVAPSLVGGLAGEIRQRAAPVAPVLSAREREVLNRIACGQSIPAIAAELYVAPSTVKTHVQRLYEKLGVSDRAAAVAEAMRQRLLD